MTFDINPANTPLLLIAWRRPHTLRQVIDAIRPVAPTRLYVACDGPNPERPGEAEKVAATRAVIEHEIDWPCQIERLYSDVNQGCRLGVSRAITWFFEQVEEGIILEDDCVPAKDFFDYCNWAINAFRDDKQVMHINGNNFSAKSSLFIDDVSFVSLPQVWGWASWSDRWRDFVLNPFYVDRCVRPEQWCLSWDAKIAKLSHLKSLKNGLDTWDYIWQITILDRGGLAVCPRNNLVSNIGIGSDATHTFKDYSRTVLQTGSFIRPESKPFVRLNRRLSRFYEKKMGLSLTPSLVFWYCISCLLKLKGFALSALRTLLLSRDTPVVVASTGRSGSTMLVKAIASSFIKSKYPRAPRWIQKNLARLAFVFYERIHDAAPFGCPPVIKTHDLFSANANLDFKYIFVYGDPLDSAISVFQQGKILGTVWVEEHIFHLCGNGAYDQIFYHDVLNYEAQILAWKSSQALCVHYSEIWDRQNEISKFLGFCIYLPSCRDRAANELAPPLDFNQALFDRLKSVESNFRDSVSYLR